MNLYYYELINKGVTFVGTWNWAEIVKILVSIWLATVATLALTTWKRQSKAHKQTEFLDEITKSIIEFINLFEAPLWMAKFIKIRIDSERASHQREQSLENTEAVAYIQRCGEEDAKRLDDYLEPCTGAIAKIRSLVAKGQVFGFRNYEECEDACAMLSRHYDKFKMLCYIIGSPSLEWTNPKVQEWLSNLMALDPDDIDKEVKSENEKFLKFVKDTYKHIFN